MNWFNTMGALINLDHPGHFIHWHFIEISVANFIVIVLMVATFVTALLAPFPGRRRRRETR
ncbi:MAG TPA: hypothetical protein PLG60_05945 [Acidimicrobiales bacterium]|nr:MAG: hypothetical protein B7X07_04170 [Actinobacteria bacterium 21-64-8]HQU00029.1 hypothetical protein [Acidimicrobiales bacterium]